MDANFEGSFGTSTNVKTESDGRIIVSRQQDVTEHLNTTRELHNSGFTGGKDVKLAASIPVVVVEAYCNQNGITFEAFMQDRAHQKRILNDKSLEHFRIWKGRV
jgi:hypothetical protein